MKLFRSYMKTCIKTAEKNNMKSTGDWETHSSGSRIFRRAYKSWRKRRRTIHGLNFEIAINYGSRDEITRAVRHTGRWTVQDGKLVPEDIDRADLLRPIWIRRDIPDPDLLIRTSGEQRLSNYLLWQLAYTEFYFTDVPWPDFTKKELWKRPSSSINKP